MRQAKIGKETFVFLILFLLLCWYMASIMGLAHMFGSVMQTSFSLLKDTVFFIMSITVLAGALSALFSEFGVITLLQKIITPIMRPLFGLPGVASLGAITAFLSDNPAILALAKDRRIRGYFKKYEIAALTNIGTGFGMGLIVFTYMAGLGFASASAIGVAGAIIGSLISTRLMLIFTKKHYIKTGQWEEQNQYDDTLEVKNEAGEVVIEEEEKRNYFDRFMNAMLDGGKNGVEMGVSIIPGVLCVCTFVMMMTFGPGPDGYGGKAYEGIAILPVIGQYISPVTDVLFGFKDPTDIAFPITALGAVGAALGTLPQMLAKNLVGPNEIAVFTGIGMCWSGYLSTHISMMDALGKRELVSFALIAHTIGGLCAGVAAHYLFILIGG